MTPHLRTAQKWGTRAQKRKVVILSGAKNLSVKILAAPEPARERKSLS